MCQILFSPADWEQLHSCHNVDAYIVGIDLLSVNFFAMTLDEVITLINKTDKDIYIALNKNMSNNDLPLLEGTLKTLNKYQIKGIFYADVSLIPITKRLHINIPLIWANEHLTTNYGTMNYWHKFKVKGTFISNDITLIEIMDILKKYKGFKIVQVFGYLPMYVSKRHAIKNYLTYFNLQTKSHQFKLFKEDKYYPIIDNDIGTIILSSNVLCDLMGFCKLKQNDLDIALINGYGFSADIINKVLTIFNSVNDNNAEKLQSQLISTISNIDSGFWYRKTIYKVKKNEK